MSDQWLSIVEYARQFNMSDMTVRRRIKTGKIHAVLRDGKYYIPMSEALRKLTNQSHQQQSLIPQPSRAPAQQPLVKPNPIAERAFQGMDIAPQHKINPLVEAHHIQTPSHMPMQQRHSSMSTLSGFSDPSTLLAFCEGALRKSSEAEQRLDQMYKERIGRLEAEVSARDAQIKHLSQQVEDLQLLTKILEKKSGAKI